MSGLNLVRDGLGAANAGKYAFQASRSAQGLSTTTPLTAGLDLAAGTSDVGGATMATEAAGGLPTTARGVTGAARLSNAARIASFASAAAPIVARASAGVGLALGGTEVGRGINDLTDGKGAEGRDKIISGGADMVTAGALGVAAVSSGTVVGLPVAAVALGVAGVAQAGKYAWKYRENIADGARWTADGDQRRCALALRLAAGGERGRGIHPHPGDPAPGRGRRTLHRTSGRVGSPAVEQARRTLRRAAQGLAEALLSVG